jgi:hypothetical protein
MELDNEEYGRGIKNGEQRPIQVGAPDNWIIALKQS